MVLRTSETKFVDFLTGCLQWDPRDRFTPEDALQQEWILEGYARHAAQREHAAQRDARGDASHRSHGAHEGSMASMASPPSSSVVSAKRRSQHNQHQHHGQHGQHVSHRNQAIEQHGSHRSQGIMAATASSTHTGGFVFPPIESQSGMPTSSKHHKMRLSKEESVVAPPSTGGANAGMAGGLGATSGGGIGTTGEASKALPMQEPFSTDF